VAGKVFYPAETVQGRTRLPSLTKSPSGYKGLESKSLLVKDHSKLVILPSESQKLIRPPVVSVPEKASK